MTDLKGRTMERGGQPRDGGQRMAADGSRRGLLFLSPLVAVLLYTLLALVITHPLWRNLAEAVPGDIGDPLLNTWIIAWDAHAILTNLSRLSQAGAGLFDANIFYPLPNSLAYSEHLFSTAALILPLGLVSGQPVLAYNLSLLLSFPLAGLGMYVLILRWTDRRGAAFLAGLAFAFAPYRLAAIAHLQLLTVQWLPFSLLALDRLLKYQTSNGKYQISNGKYQISNGKCQISNIKWQMSNDKCQMANGKWQASHGVSGVPYLRPDVAKYLLLFMIFTTLQVLASWYLAVFTALVLGLYTLGWWVSHLRQGKGRRGNGRATLSALGRVVVAALVVIVLVFPFAVPYLEVLPQLLAARPASLAGSLAAQPTDFLAAPSYLRIAGPLTQTLAERPGFTEENALFLGVVALPLALAGLVFGCPRWRAITLAAVLVVSLALTFAGPYLTLTRILPALSVVRVPPRWIIPATFALAALAGLGVAGLGQVRGWGIRKSGARESGNRTATWLDSRKTWLAFVSGVGLLLVVESFAVPLPLASVGGMEDFPPVYYALQREALREPGEWGIVEIPMHVAPAPEFPETKRMYPSTLGWWGLVNGYSGFTPSRQMALSQALADFPNGRAIRTLEMLGEDGVRYLIVHPGEAPMDRAVWEATDRWEAERGTSLLPVGRFGPDDLYLINPYADDLITNPMAVTDPYLSANAPTPLNVRFSSPTAGGDIWLLAYLSSDLSADPILSLYWQTSAPLDTAYTVFVHSLNAQGELTGQADGPPAANHYPTTIWRLGEIVQDSRPVPPGDHYLVGLYDPATGERLPAFAVDGTRLPDDAVVLVAGQR